MNKKKKAIKRVDIFVFIKGTPDEPEVNILYIYK